MSVDNDWKSIAIDRHNQILELNIELGRVKAENEAMAEFKAHMVSMRETHGFDSWAAALVEIDNLRTELKVTKQALESLKGERDGLLHELGDDQ